MSDFVPYYRIGEAYFFRYVPFDTLNPATGEMLIQTPDIPCTILSIAHSFDWDIQTGPGTYLPRVFHPGWSGFYYFVEIDQMEAAAMGLSLTCPNGSPLTHEVIKETQITGERIAF